MLLRVSSQRERLRRAQESSAVCDRLAPALSPRILTLKSLKDFRAELRLHSASPLRRKTGYLGRPHLGPCTWTPLASVGEMAKKSKGKSGPATPKAGKALKRGAASTLPSRVLPEGKKPGRKERGEFCRARLKSPCQQRRSARVWRGRCCLQATIARRPRFAF